MKTYSLDLRQKIVDAYTQGEESVRKVASRFKVARSFVQKLIKRYQQEQTIEPLPHGGGFASQLSEHSQAIAQLVEESPDATLQELCEKLYEQTGVEVSRSTMCRFLEKLNLTRKKSRFTQLKLKV